MFRQISNKELADLPCKWENPTVDINVYIQNVFYAVEVDEDVYELHKRKGGLCQKHKEKYYIA